MLVAQGLVAAGRTVRDALPHALHAHFLRAGRHGLVVEWDAERARDGRQFAARRVVGRQAGATIFLLPASFTRAQAGLAPRDPMPTVPPPGGLPDRDDPRVLILLDPGTLRPLGPPLVRKR